MYNVEQTSISIIKVWDVMDLGTSECADSLNGVMNLCKCWLVVAGSWELEAEEKTLYGEVAEAVLGALAPATIYQVRTFAENELGRSKEGRVVQVTSDNVNIYIRQIVKM